MNPRHSIFPVDHRANVAFTFVEILVSLIFLAILLPAIVEGIRISSRAATSVERGVIAAELAQNKLGELTVNDAWTNSDAAGDFGADWPDYRWEQTQTEWDLDNMTVLSVKVFFPVQGNEQSLSLSTLVSSNSSSGTTSNIISNSSNQSK